MHFLQSKERLAKLFKERPLIAYRRPKSLRDMLVSSKLRSETIKDEANTEHGCGPCNKPRCSWCLHIEKATTLTCTNQADRTFDILHTVNCQSAFVIYIIECRICKLQYAGKIETAFNLRLNNHRSHFKRGFRGWELTEQFLHNSRTHNFDRDTKITIIEEIKRYEMHIKRKKEILCTREVFWQKKLMTLKPNGLNKTMG